MRQLMPLIVLSIFSFSVNAKTDKCITILVGGAKEWTSLLPGGLPTDISFAVDRIVRREAARTGCSVITGQNQTPEEFTRMIQNASRPPLFTPGTKIHISFNDHGNPQPDNPTYRSIYIGQGQYLNQNDFGNMLRTHFPSGTRLTTSSSICWGSIHEMPFQLNLDSHFDMCGSASTDTKHLSYNGNALTRSNGIIRGPYSGVGMAAAADRARENRTLSVNEYHQIARRGDYGNIDRMPGLLTSVAYAKHVLSAKKEFPIINYPPLNSLIDKHARLVPLKQGEENFNEQTVSRDILRTIETFGDCNHLSTNLFVNQFLGDMASLFKTLDISVVENLPEPMRTQAQAATDYLLNNKHEFTRLLTEIIKAKAAFWARNRVAMNDPEQSGRIINQWKSESQRLTSTIEPYLFHMRNIQEARTVEQFLNHATPEERTRFNRFVACESRPVI